MSRLPDLDLSAYLELDARLGWKVDERVEFSIGGRNLLRDHHGEFRSQVISVLPAEVQRSGYGRMTWSF